MEGARGRVVWTSGDLHIPRGWGEIWEKRLVGAVGASALSLTKREDEQGSESDLPAHGHKDKVWQSQGLNSGVWQTPTCMPLAASKGATWEPWNTHHPPCLLPQATVQQCGHLPGLWIMGGRCWESLSDVIPGEHVRGSEMEMETWEAEFEGLWWSGGPPLIWVSPSQMRGQGTPRWKTGATGMTSSSKTWSPPWRPPSEPSGKHLLPL